MVKNISVVAIKLKSISNIDFHVNLQREIALGRRGESGHHALRLAETDRGKELGLKQNKKFQVAFALVRRRKLIPAA